MDDEDFILQQELEALAGNAYNHEPDETVKQAEPISKTMARWQKLFGLSQDDAIDSIMDHRNNLTRTRISDAHWDTVRNEKEDDGYDKEAYEYELNLQKKRAALPEMLPATESADSSITYLIELSGPLDDVERVQQAAEMQDSPETVSGRSLEEGRSVQLCCIDGQAKKNILQWAVRRGGAFEPTILVNPRSLQR